MFIDHFYFKLLLKQKVSMDPVHYMGSMDLVQISVPWTSPKWGVHVLSSPPDKSVSVKRRLRTADCRRRTGGKMQTECKMQIADGE